MFLIYTTMQFFVFAQKGVLQWKKAKIQPEWLNIQVLQIFCLAQNVIYLIMIIIDVI